MNILERALSLYTQAELAKKMAKNGYVVVESTIHRWRRKGTSEKNFRNVATVLSKEARVLSEELLKKAEEAAKISVLADNFLNKRVGE